jgi:hypothetical protein
MRRRLSGTACAHLLVHYCLRSLRLCILSVWLEGQLSLGGLGGGWRLAEAPEALSRVAGAALVLCGHTDRAPPPGPVSVWHMAAAAAGGAGALRGAGPEKSLRPHRGGASWARCWPACVCGPRAPPPLGGWTRMDQYQCGSHTWSLHAPGCQRAPVTCWGCGGLWGVQIFGRGRGRPWKTSLSRRHRATRAARAPAHTTSCTMALGQRQTGRCAAKASQRSARWRRVLRCQAAATTLAPARTAPAATPPR